MDVLSNVFPTHTVSSMVIEEVYDWLMKNNLEEENHNQNIFKRIKNLQCLDFFGITTDQVTNRDIKYISIN